MRIFLCTGLLTALKDPPELPKDHLIFECAEDFSHGPLCHWNNPKAFAESRARFFDQSGLLDTPFGPKLDYQTFHIAAIKSDEAEELYEFHDIAAQAEAVEIWTDTTVTGCANLWYLSVQLPRMGIDLARVNLCIFPDSLNAQHSQTFWHNLLLDNKERELPAKAARTEQWQHLQQCWDALVQQPAPLSATLQNSSKPYELHALQIIFGRHLNPKTGLTNLQTRLLLATPTNWTNMLRVIGDAMLAGIPEKDRVNDRLLHSILKDMTQLSPPLVNCTQPLNSKYGDVRLTKQGEAKKRSLQAPT